MTIYSGIFNSVNGDRKYNAWWFAKYFATFIGNGVFPNPSTNLQVVSNENMKVVVKPGSGWIDGYFIFSDGDHVLSLDIADGVLKRIDRVVMRLNHFARKIEIVVKKGTFASSPVAPVLQRDGNAYELVLADVFVANGATQITQANITDTRLNNSLCGIVHGTVNQVDTTTLFNQYQSWIEQQKAIYTQELELWTADQRLSFEQWMAVQHYDFANWRQLEEQEFADWMLAQQASFNNWMQKEQTDFQAWVSNLKELLDENIAAALTAKVTTLEQEMDAVGTLLGEKANNTDLKSLQDTFGEHVMEGNPNAHKAKNIVLEDVAGIFVAENIEEGMKELFTNVSNGKQLIGTAITDVDNSLVVPTNPTFQNLANSIRSISTGKKWASGYSASDTIAVSGLPFNPFMVVVIGNDQFSVITNLQKATNGYIFYRTTNGGNYYVSTASIANNGFNIRMRYSGVTWYAFE
ncbi:hypothetical protein NY607_01600 [Lysinibacillus sp. A4]|uniref:hypothetical protein n=1 Tax=Lysinibacillus sp. A4 TaxID=2976269 RepID=UPI002175DBAA|nr:hypothetical protein [Lysinibacillus sp. A4]MCS5499797.1 hypothetical protein [Lysinibacillus sp. A4]